MGKSPVESCNYLVGCVDSRSALFGLYEGLAGANLAADAFRSRLEQRCKENSIQGGYVVLAEIIKVKEFTNLGFAERIEEEL